jgi:hypothetical protein
VIDQVDATRIVIRATDMVECSSRSCRGTATTMRTRSSSASAS